MFMQNHRRLNSLRMIWVVLVLKLLGTGKFEKVLIIVAMPFHVHCGAPGALDNDPLSQLHLNMTRYGLDRTSSD